MSKTFEDIMEEAYSLPEGLAKITVLEEAARVADMANDIDGGYEARSMIVETATFNGYPMKALVSFSWILGQFDKNEDVFDSYDVLWNYKWILDRISHFPEISLEQINHLLEDLRTRYKQHGYSERMYYLYKSANLLLQGKHEEAAECMDNFKKMQSDEMSDCTACEQNRLVEFAAITKRDEEALLAAKPILSGRMSCGEVPHVTISKVLMPLYRLGRLEEAEEQQRKGYRLIKNNLEFVQQIGEHIYYLSKVDPFKGLEVLERHYPLMLQHENPTDRMLFLAYSSALLKRLSEEEAIVKVRLPDTSPYAVEAAAKAESGNAAWLAEQFIQEALVIADRLDIRNGNTYYREFIQEL